MYKLTLTSQERLAFDFIDGRYETSEIADILIECMSDENEWSSDKEITFSIPESYMWIINEIVEESKKNNGVDFPCFNYQLVVKLNDFLCQMV